MFIIQPPLCLTPQNFLHWESTYQWLEPSFGVVKTELLLKLGGGFPWGGMGFEIDFFVFHMRHKRSTH
jgi:hypothetical protein